MTWKGYSKFNNWGLTQKQVDTFMKRVDRLERLKECMKPPDNALVQQPLDERYGRRYVRPLCGRDENDC